MKKEKKPAAHVYRRGVEVTAPAKKKKLPTYGKVLIIVGAVILAIAITITSLFFYYFGGLQTTDFQTNLSDLGVDSVKDSQIKNIALFGVDSRTAKISGRSDAIMILTVDMKHNKIKITSILRDSRVAVEGHGQTKVCHAYAYGGAELAVKTLNQNFDLDITEYASVNFQRLEELVDAVGGVNIAITNAEATQVTGISKAGTYKLTGSQAVQYCRIRKIDSDTARAERQQKVMIAMFNQVKNTSKLDYPEMIRKLLPLVETSMSYSDCMGLTPIALASNLEIVQKHIPGDGDGAKGGMVDGTWYWVYDVDAAAKKLNEFIYETGADEQTSSTASDTAQSSSK